MPLCQDNGNLHELSTRFSQWHTNPSLSRDLLRLCRKYKFLRDKYKLVSHLNLDSFDQKIHLIKTNLMRTREICFHHAISDLSLCKTSVLIIERLSPSIIEKYHILKDLGNQYRKKETFKTLFGAIDDDDVLQWGYP